MRIKSTHNITYAVFAMTILFGGLNAIFIRNVVAELPPFWGATLRFAPASFLLFLLMGVQRLPLPKGRALLGVIIYGVLNFGLAYAFAFRALRTISPGMAMVILSLTPLFTLLFAILHGQEKFRWQVLVGSLLSTSGIIIIAFHQISLEGSLLPVLLIILNAASIAEATVIFKTFPKSHPVTVNAIGMAAGTVLLFIASLLWREPHPVPVLPATWVALAYLTLIGSCLLFIMVLYVLKRWTASATTYAFVMLPFVTILVSSLMGQEKLTLNFVFGGILLLIGVYAGALHKPVHDQAAQPTIMLEEQPSHAASD